MKRKLGFSAASPLIALLVVTFVIGRPTPSRARDKATLPPLGVVMKEHGTVCFSIEQTKLPLGTQVSLILLLGTPQMIVSAQIAGPGAQCSQFDGMTSYALRTTPVKLPDIVAGVGALTPMSQLRMRGKSATLAVVGLPPIVFRSCPSTDGFHVTAWQNQALTGQLVWHRYIYLNQDLVSTCLDKETQNVGLNNG